MPPVHRSDHISELAQALAKAQGLMTLAARSSENADTQSRYADLASVWNACRQPLADHGLSVVQIPSWSTDRVTVGTVLMHASGQWIESELSAVPKSSAMTDISAVITFLRRVALSSMIGVAPQEDDGSAPQSAQRRAQPAAQREAAPAPAQPTGPIEPIADVLLGISALRTGEECAAHSARLNSANWRNAADKKTAGTALRAKWKAILDKDKADMKAAGKPAAEATTAPETPQAKAADEAPAAVDPTPEWAKQDERDTASAGNADLFDSKPIDGVKVKLSDGTFAKTEGDEIQGRNEAPEREPGEEG